MRKLSKNTVLPDRCPKDGHLCQFKRDHMKQYKAMQWVIYILVLFIACLMWASCGVNHYMAATMVDRFGDTTGFTFIEYGKGNILNYGN